MGRIRSFLMRAGWLRTMAITTTEKCAMDQMSQTMFVTNDIWGICNFHRGLACVQGDPSTYVQVYPLTTPPCQSLIANRG